MGWRPLERNKSGKQEKDKRCFETLLDHEGIEFMLPLGLLHQ
jgi:hypothetical protein